MLLEERVQVLQMCADLGDVLVCWGCVVDTEVTKDNVVKDIPAHAHLLAPFRYTRVMPSVIRGQAIITLGKLCLQPEDLIKNSVPILV